MTLSQIVQLARSMMAELRNGLQRACRYLQSLNFPPEFAVWALRGIR
jgi:hypothetical protein